MNDDEIGLAAAFWHQHQAGPEMDWSAFERWLAEDPRHREAYDDVALLDLAVAERRDVLRRSLTPPAATRVGDRVRPVYWAAGIAAAVAVAGVVVSMQTAQRNQAPTTAQAYKAGIVPLAVRLGRAQVKLAPGSVLTPTRDGAGEVALNGRATFAVGHDPRHPFRILAGGYAVTDVGTQFEIVASADAIQVRVTNGTIAVQPPGRDRVAIPVIAGQVATGFSDGEVSVGAASLAIRSPLPDRSITYDDMPLGLLAADLSRITGQHIVADRSIGKRRFSGVIARTEAEAMAGTVAALTGTEARRQGDTIALVARARPRP